MRPGVTLQKSQAPSFSPSPLLAPHVTQPGTGLCPVPFGMRPLMGLMFRSLFLIFTLGLWFGLLGGLRARLPPAMRHLPKLFVFLRYRPSQSPSHGFSRCSLNSFLPSVSMTLQRLFLMGHAAAGRASQATGQLQPQMFLHMWTRISSVFSFTCCCFLKVTPLYFYFFFFLMLINRFFFLF